ncbi:hypothetical protein E0H75_07205 [Kribbella capetownensis]|uniref:Uncharacterized protein n=1 Tax=Kribbella capetownensis TaxID=1572659 RepID=A0A4R0K0N8_9ACTN|nr:hypothetical protein [Kribbella capetownensis]TCC53471.1 hypothetical protein E0H75_07205 [Kribbella capetownensis]
MTTPNTTPTTAPSTAAAELRAYYGCREVEARGLRALPAYDEHGRQTGQVAIDADEFCDWLDDLYQGDGD